MDWVRACKESPENRVETASPFSEAGPFNEMVVMGVCAVRLQGLNKAETAAKYGDEQVHIWRRSYDIPPPALELSDERHPSHDPRYAGIDNLPATESLALTLERVKPCWEELIAPELRAGKNVLIAAHGNSLRALVKMLDEVSDEDITGFNIPTGIPLAYELDDHLKPVSREFLGDPEAVAKAAAAVAAQGKAK